MRSCVVALLAAAAALAGCGEGNPSAGVARRSRVVHGDGVRYVVPVGWHAAAGRSLTPRLKNPREVLTVGTGRLPAGGVCAQFPSTALRAMGARDVLVTVQERLGSPAAFPVRPTRFKLPAGETRNEAQACAGSRPRFTSYWFGFRDAGRGFHVLVAVGRSAPRVLVRRALGVLDSLRVTRRPPVRIDPDDAIPYDDSTRGLHLVHPSAWRLYPRALTQAVAARDQMALGTFPLHQRRPDPNCSPATALHARRPSDGFLFMLENRGLSRRELARFPRRPARLRLTRSSLQPYECMGPSWLVRFRDRGRAFQAYLYGPPRRRREALAILDSLRLDRASLPGH